MRGRPLLLTERKEFLPATHPRAPLTSTTFPIKSLEDAFPIKIVRFFWGGGHSFVLEGVLGGSSQVSQVVRITPIYKP